MQTPEWEKYISGCSSSNFHKLHLHLMKEYSFRYHVKIDLISNEKGDALMAEWSKALPLTATCLSPYPASNLGWGKWESCQWLGLGDGFRRVLRFPPPLTTGLSLIMEEKVTLIQILMKGERNMWLNVILAVSSVPSTTVKLIVSAGNRWQHLLILIISKSAY